MAAQEVVDLFVGVRNPGVSPNGSRPGLDRVAARQASDIPCYSRGGEYSESWTKNGRVRPG